MAGRLRTDKPAFCSSGRDGLRDGQLYGTNECSEKASHFELLYLLDTPGTLNTALKASNPSAAELVQEFVKWAIPNWPSLWSRFKPDGTMTWETFEALIRRQTRFGQRALRQIFDTLADKDTGALKKKSLLEARRHYEQCHRIAHKGLEGLRKLLTAKYRHPTIGWRTVFDPHDTYVCSFTHFVKVCKQIGYNTDVKALWKECSQGNANYILDHQRLAPQAHELLLLLADVLIKTYGSFYDGWEAMLHSNGKFPRLTASAFRDFLHGLGFSTSQSKELLICLDLNRDDAISEKDLGFFAQFGRRIERDRDGKRYQVPITGNEDALTILCDLTSQTPEESEGEALPEDVTSGEAQDEAQGVPESENAAENEVELPAGAFNPRDEETEFHSEPSVMAGEAAKEPRPLESMPEEVGFILTEEEMAELAARKVVANQERLLKKGTKRLHPGHRELIRERLKEALKFGPGGHAKGSMGKFLKALDYNRGGTVDVDELKYGVRNVLNISHIEMTDKDVVDLFGELDTDESGDLSISEFFAWVNSTSVFSERGYRSMHKPSLDNAVKMSYDLQDMQPESPKVQLLPEGPKMANIADVPDLSKTGDSSTEVKSAKVVQMRKIALEAVFCMADHREAGSVNVQELILHARALFKADKQKKIVPTPEWLQKKNNSKPDGESDSVDLEAFKTVMLTKLPSDRTGYEEAMDLLMDAAKNLHIDAKENAKEDVNRKEINEIDWRAHVRSNAAGVLLTAAHTVDQMPGTSSACSMSSLLRCVSVAKW
eukprot:TRINITY_DN19358_c0_g2_i2.p1 TRINITY_DN19358_c0_g2~~TRINITY_DN19358_c0_g2_i2.p1  ORF type:complete len:773 (-),score=174.46 TRINITY_DN19358_c0_g2_i2:409-2727(-)